MKPKSFTRILSAVAFVAMLLASSSLFAQVKVGNNPTTISPNAVLEMESTNKGMIIPRIQLTANTDAVTIPDPVDGMVVYNTNNSATNLSRGLVYWNSLTSSWLGLQTQSISNNGINSRDLTANVTTVAVNDASSASNTNAAQLNFGTIALPQDGAYAFSFRLFGSRNPGAGIYYIYLLYDGVVKDIAEIDLANAANTSHSYSITLGAGGKSGQNVTVKMAHLVNSNANTTPWTLISTPGLYAYKTSVIYWKL